jgi:hypothetical protein
LLSEEQKHYAALDAWISLDIWKTLLEKPTHGAPLKSAAPVGQAISVYERKQEVAYGVIIVQPHQFCLMDTSVMINISTTRTRAVIKVEEVLVPQYILPLHKRTLEDLRGSDISFEAVVHLSSLRTYSTDATVIPLPVAPLLIDRQSVLLIQPPEGMEVARAASPADDSDDKSGSENDAGAVLRHFDQQEDESSYVQPVSEGIHPSRILADVFHEMDKVR